QHLEDDPEVRPDHGPDQEHRRQPVDVDPGTGCLDALGDEHDRERVRDRPEEERQLPPRVAPDEVPVALDDAAEPDQLAPQRPPGCALHHANTSRSSSSSASNAAPVAAKNASSSDDAP